MKYFFHPNGINVKHEWTPCVFLAQEPDAYLFEHNSW